MIQLLPARADVVARTLHPHLDRGNARSREARDLIVVHLLPDLEQERLAMEPVQAFHRPHQLRAQLETVPPGRRGGRVLGKPAGSQPRLAPAALPPRAPAAVDEDAVKPGAERLALPIGAEPAIGPDERLLHGVLRVGGVAEQMPREAKAGFVIALDQSRIGAGPTGEHLGDQLRVRHALLEWGRPGPPASRPRP